MQKTASRQIGLPDRPEITLCEAVTAFAVGKASDSFDHDLFGEAETEEERAKAKNLIERLHSAAYAGRIRFRALKNGDSHADGHKDIDPLYFSERRGLRWDYDEIWVSGLSRKRPTFESQGRFTMAWWDVHLDREGFEALLQAMGVSVVQSLDAAVPANQKIFYNGLAGRPTSIRLVLAMALCRLNAGDYPDSKTKFAEQLAEHFAKAEPLAPRMSAKTLFQNPEFGELWRRKAPKIIDPT